VLPVNLILVVVNDVPATTQLPLYVVRVAVELAAQPAAVGIALIKKP